MKYNKFEETPVWQTSRKLVSDIYELIFSNTKLKNDYSLSDQLKRASYSIMLNISEGFERGSNKDFAHFIDFAKGSAGEVRSITYIMLDNGYIKEGVFKVLNDKLLDISSQLSSFKKYLIKNNFKKDF